METAPIQSAELEAALPAVGRVPVGEISASLVDELFQMADCELVGLSQAEFAEILLRVGGRHNFGLAAGTVVGSAQVAVF